MRILDFYPSQGTYVPGEAVTFIIELETDSLQNTSLRILIQHLAEPPIAIEDFFELGVGEQTVRMRWMPPASPAGYSARLEILSPNDGSLLRVATAFDVLSHWTDFPRYGFLSDFSSTRADPDTVLNRLTRFHINGLQFYDWQYRHDQLLAPTEEYIDPLGREMSLASVRELVDSAHRHGMAAIPYLAIYAASADFWRVHPNWALYDEAGMPIAFGENFLGLMNPSADSPWSKYLLAESGRALQDVPFDGLHIDQYGEPKLAWDTDHDPVDLPKAFNDFIQSASDQHPDKTVLFNAVGNWPIEAVAKSAVDFVYIEVWPPAVQYRNLAEIVLDAVRLSHGKAVIIALYLPASRPANNLLADAVIIACGGSRIELGESVRLLSDPYFPKHEEITPDLQNKLRQLSDFMVRNGEWLRPYILDASEKEIWTESELNPAFISTEDFIWTVARRTSRGMTLQLVNFTTLGSQPRWDEEHPAPEPCQNVSVKIQRSQRPAHIFWDSPEAFQGSRELRFKYANETLVFQIPNIHFLGLVVIYD